MSLWISNESGDSFDLGSRNVTKAELTSLADLAERTAGHEGMTFDARHPSVNLEVGKEEIKLI